MIVADTSAWIDYFRGTVAPHTDLLDRELSKSRIIIGDLIMTELLQGFSGEREFQVARQLMESLEYRDFVGKDMAIAAAQNYRILRRKGITVRKTIDVLIATFCIENGVELIHNDRDFDPMEQVLGLRVLR
ncbi:putative nucleic acid-binding protein [Desulfomicrobium macestii]|uniref:Ribonuclease VapC n=1 Tax=Desulfomicrobium macestii TaxID=90731 RepID=A0ABR9H5L5_9BACT|nr:PIN domain nuclease [Desulfomicrobium macestii]MBE1425975.1 putative nucleic acid-binding protein [Desulfomicrobium macestii]